MKTKFFLKKIIVGISDNELCKNCFCYFIEKSTTQTAEINSWLPKVKYLYLYMPACPPLARYRQTAVSLVILKKHFSVNYFLYHQENLHLSKISGW